MSQTAVGSHSPINHVLEQAARLRRLAAGSAPRPAESARAPRPDSAEVSRPQSPREEAAARARRRERREQQVEGAVRGGAMAESSGRFRREADRGDRSLANRRGAPADNLESAVRRLESQGHSARPVGTGADLNRAFENHARRSAHARGEAYRPGSTGWESPHQADAGAYRARVGENGLRTVRVASAEGTRFENGRQVLGTRSGARERGAFHALESDLDGLTRSEIRDRLAIDHRPRFLQRTRLAPGSEVNLSRIGVQNSLPNGARVGGGVQFHDASRNAVDRFAQRAPERPTLAQRISRVRNGREATTSAGNIDLRARDAEIRAQRVASRFRGVGRILRPVGVIADAFSLRGAYQRDGNRIGRETTREVASISGSLAGGWAGAQAGAAIGALGGPVGVVVGGIVGGVIGGFLGSELGRSLF